MPCRRWEDDTPSDAAEGGKGEIQCNTQSAFETSKYNSCNIRLKADETLEHAFETL
jgi:hypothetical protein